MFFKGFKSLCLFKVLCIGAIEFAMAQSVSINANEIVQNIEITPKAEKAANELVNLAIQRVNNENLEKAKTLVKEARESKKYEVLLNKEVGTSLDKDKNQTIDIKKFLSDYGKVQGSSKKGEQLPNLLVFISLSLPENSLKQLSEQVAKAGGVLVLRGLYKGSLKETVNILYKLNEKGVAAIIHPKLFQKFQVKTVPNFVLNSQNNASIDKMAGNISLEYVLRKFAEKGDNKELAKEYLNKIEVML